jgi:hypothetical protein
MWFTSIRGMSRSSDDHVIDSGCHWQMIPVNLCHSKNTIKPMLIGDTRRSAGMVHPAIEQRRMKESWNRFCGWWLDSYAIREKDFILLSLNYGVSSVCRRNGVAIRRPYVNVYLFIWFVHRNTICRCLQRDINIINSCDWGPSQCIGEPLRELLLPESLSKKNCE